ncbi:hypothetical protein C8J57DRAFT_1627845, partial [Mycena rebaudengoi]
MMSHTNKITGDILDSNHPPSESQIPVIRDIIASRRAHRIRLDAEIAKLVGQRGDLDTDIQKHEAALSPLRRMPPELLSLIFAFTQTATKLGMQFILSQVCHRWRAILTGQPLFLVDITID